MIRALNALKRPGDIDLGLGEPTRKPDMRPFEAALTRIAALGCPYTPNAVSHTLLPEPGTWPLMFPSPPPDAMKSFPSEAE